MKIFNFILFVLCFSLMGCQVGYVIKSGYQQMHLLYERQPIDEVLKNPSLPPEIRHKLELAREVKIFAQKKLGLNAEKIYESYVQLNRPYVIYAVNAAEKNKLKSYQWWFPIVGTIPYKGYFSLDEGKAEEEYLKEKNLDTYLRGVTAYSTIGWFNDPLLSSMMEYEDRHLVNTIIHESTHATIFISNQVDFNEQLATFVGGKGAELFYLEKEGPQSPTVAKIKAENEDDKKFSAFLKNELDQLETWYSSTNEITEELRQSHFQEIKDHFNQQLKPQLKTNQFESFDKKPLNNARLLLLKTYLMDLSQFEELYTKVNGNFPAFLQACKNLGESK